ncbi:MAG: dihydroorotase, partial [Eubacteriales bacterium]
NTNPVVDSVEALAYILEKGRTTGIHVYSCSAITKGLKGKELADLEVLKEWGAVGITDDGIPLMDETLLLEAMRNARELGLPISLHEEDASLITTNGINQEIAQGYLGTDGSPREAESKLVGRDLEFALQTGVILNVQHISTKEAVDYVRNAKKKCNSSIHAEATPHHFTLTQEAVLEHGTLAKMNPPLRTEEDRLAIIKGLQDNTIDIIATDHAPHTIEEKELPFSKAPSGIIGLETALSLGITHLVDPGHLTMMQLIEKMSVNPANLYGLEAGILQEKHNADLVLFREEDTWTVEHFHSKSRNSPFYGNVLKGVIQYTICNGKIVYEKE